MEKLQIKPIYDRTEIVDLLDWIEIEYCSKNKRLLQVRATRAWICHATINPISRQSVNRRGRDVVQTLNVY